MPNNVDGTTPLNSESDVRREKALILSGGKSRPGTGSLHPVAIGKCQCRDKTPAVLPVLPTAVTSTLAGTR